MNANELLASLCDGTHDGMLASLYPDAVDSARSRYIKAAGNFLARFGNGEVSVYSSAGRTEIGGNHTDHQHGKVLAASVDLDTIAVVAPRGDNAVCLLSEGYEPIRVDLTRLEPDEKETGTTSALIRGVAAGCMARGFRTGGFDAYVSGNVPAGSGLSSSASFEVLMGAIFSGMYNDGSISPVTIAMIGQEAENRFFGKPCGLMDQVACAVGGLVHIDFRDESHPAITPVNADFGRFGYCLCITNTGGSHADLTDAYAAIPAEMKAVASQLGGLLLCDVKETDLLNTIPTLRKTVGDRAILRAMHFFAENRRVDAQKAALEAGDFMRFLSAVYESGRSSYELLQNIHPDGASEQGIALALAISEKIMGGKGVCRVHGGGFAGTIQAFVPAQIAPMYRQELDRVFGEGACRVMHVRARSCGKVM